MRNPVTSDAEDRVMSGAFKWSVTNQRTAEEDRPLN